MKISGYLLHLTWYALSRDELHVCFVYITRAHVVILYCWYNAHTYRHYFYTTHYLSIKLSIQALHNASSGKWYCATLLDNTHYYTLYVAVVVVVVDVECACMCTRAWHTCTPNSHISSFHSIYLAEAFMRKTNNGFVSMYMWANIILYVCLCVCGCEFRYYFVWERVRVVRVSNHPIWNWSSFRCPNTTMHKSWWIRSTFLGYRFYSGSLLHITNPGWGPPHDGHNHCQY